MSTKPQRPETTAHLHDDPSQVDAAAWNALLDEQAAPYALHAPRVPAGAARLRQRRGRDRLGNQLLCLRHGDTLVGRLRAVPEEPLLRRVRVRLGLGRRLPAARPALLPQAARRRAVHAGAGQSAAGARCRHAPAAAAGTAADRSQRRAVVGAPAVHGRHRPQAAAERRLDAAREGAVPLAQPAPVSAMPTSTSSWPACSATSARRSRRSGAAWPRPASRSRCMPAQRSTPALWDFFHHCYTLTYARASFHALPDARLLRAHAAHDGPALGDVRGAPRRPPRRLLAARRRSRSAAMPTGRYWGCTEYVPCLHFEACYYQPLSWCIAQGYRALRRRRAGRAQDGARPAAGADALGALAERPRLRRRGGRLPGSAKAPASRPTWTNCASATRSRPQPSG